MVTNPHQDRKLVTEARGEWRGEISPYRLDCSQLFSIRPPCDGKYAAKVFGGGSMGGILVLKIGAFVNASFTIRLNIWIQRAEHQSNMMYTW